VHPDKLDQVRFSELKQSEKKNNVVRILIYFFIVVALGAGAAFGIQKLISENDKENVVEDTPEVFVSAFDINKTELLDTTTIDVPSQEDLTEAELTTVGTSTEEETVVDEIEYRNYETFNRLTFRIIGSAVPKTDITLSKNEKQLTVTFPESVSVNDLLKDEVNVGTTLTSISFDEAKNSFIFYMADDILYRVKVSDSDLIIDFSTEKEISKEGNDITENGADDVDLENEEESIVEDDEENADVAEVEDNSEGDLVEDDRNGVDLYTNDFSQNEQHIINNSLAENKIYLNTYYFYDEGSYFEFSLGQYGLTGEENTVNSSVKLETEDGQNYILWTIENLQASPDPKLNRITADDIAQTINMAGANFLSIELDKYEDGVATFKVFIKNIADFRLVAQETYDGKTQVVSLQIKD
jgi:hypothetical protein